MRLSICIPTYNRADELRVLLDSIAAQTGHELTIEVAISDNASTDDTADLVASYDALNSIYYRFETNQGFDRNLLNAVAIASGDYCWLCGSDDVLESGALAELEQTLKRHPSAAGISIGLQAYDATLQERIFLDDHISTRFASETVLRGRNGIIAAIGDRFGFMSSVIIRRSLWVEVANSPGLAAYMIGYVHLYIIAKLLHDTSVWVCLPKRLIGYRTNNESFQGRDDFARVRLDIVGYDQAFGDTLGRKNPAYRQVMRKLATDYLRSHFIQAKLRGVDRAYWRQAIPLTVLHYWRYSGFWFSTLPIAGVPRSMMLSARWLYRHTIKAARERRLAGGR